MKNIKNIEDILEQLHTHLNTLPFHYKSIADFQQLFEKKPNKFFYRFD